MPDNKPSTDGPGESPALGGVGGGVLLQPCQAECTQRMFELLGWKSFEKSPGLQDSWWWWSQHQPPFLGSPPPTDDITLHRVELQELACVQAIKVNGEEIKRHNTCWLFVTSGSIRWNWQSQSKAFPSGSGSLNLQLGSEKCCHLLAIAHNNNFKTGANILEGLMLELKLQYLGHLMRRTDSLENTLIWERLKVGGEGDDRGWDGRMSSPTQGTWV